MTKKDKLITRFKSQPRDFTYDELKSLLEMLGFEEMRKGKTSGSRVMFWHDGLQSTIMLHRPHPGNIVKSYALRQVADTLLALDLI